MRRTLTRGTSLAILLLSVLGAGVAIPAAPAGAEEPPQYITFYQNSREISIRSSMGNCDWEWPDTTWYTVGYGQERRDLQAEWACTNYNTPFTVIVRVYTHLNYIDSGNLDGFAAGNHHVEVLYESHDTGIRRVCGSQSFSSRVQGHYSEENPTYSAPTYRMGTRRFGFVDYECGNRTVSVQLKLWELGLIGRQP